MISSGVLLLRCGHHGSYSLGLLANGDTSLVCALFTNEGIEVIFSVISNEKRFLGTFLGISWEQDQGLNVLFKSLDVLLESVLVAVLPIMTD